MTVPVPERDPLLSRQGTSSSNPSPSGRESSELRLCADTAAPHAAMLPLFCGLILEPQVFEMRAVVDAVDHQGQPFHPRMTLSRSILRAIDPMAGQVLYRTREGKVVDLVPMSGAERKALRREIQMIFQDPFGSLNPRMTLLDNV